MSTDNFYHAFEASFRGSREEIHARLEVYLPFIRPFLNFQQGRDVVDLGCGRGEWIELLRDAGLNPHGVDLDDSMLEDCRSRGLSVETADAIEYLKSLPDGSKVIVSAFHLVEHIPFDKLRTLILESLRVLRPGGLLIMETPNAENISVGALTFHMDPTHIRPLPPGLLSFLPRHAGFFRAKVLRLQESARLRDSADVSLLEVLQGVSPDYAVIAQKAADAAVLAPFEPAFAAEFGLTLDTLSERFEGKFDRRLQQLGEHMAQIETAFGRQIEDYQRRLDDIYNSTSWRITTPVRTAGRYAIQVRAVAGQGVHRAIAWTAQTPRLRRLASRLLAASPRLAARLRRLVSSGVEGIGLTAHRPPTREGELTPRARQIMARLKKRQSVR